MTDGTQENQNTAKAIAPVLLTLSKQVRAVARRCFPDANDRNTLYATLGGEFLARAECMLLAHNPTKKDDVRAVTGDLLNRMRGHFERALESNGWDPRIAEGRLSEDA